MLHNLCYRWSPIEWAFRPYGTADWGEAGIARMQPDCMNSPGCKKQGHTGECAETPAPKPLAERFRPRRAVMPLAWRFATVYLSADTFRE